MRRHRKAKLPIITDRSRDGRCLDCHADLDAGGDHARWCAARPPRRSCRTWLSLVQREEEVLNAQMPHV